MPLHLTGDVLLGDYMDGGVPVLINEPFLRDPSTFKQPLVTGPSEPFEVQQVLLCEAGIVVVPRQ